MTTTIRDTVTAEVTDDVPDTATTLRALDPLSVAAGKHLDHLRVARVDWIRVTKVAEEAGEVVGALIKLQEGRAEFEDVRSELGDVFLAALAAADQLGLRPSDVVADRWKVVSTR
ncbi:hypothetical protein OG921_26300 [Aldersonia sp. NBC_00410]|uniref:MazG nucleotide pyrophosphohydrolase domain-containing protein n=1 Tax=Aldersonia sp. NBC_00410 TaxID=2975954 RepID=UPI00225304DC|nr:MazG nucleotide pyrophosphohydrolase domain-containing protein [Aldersonia sp. NBC_00410]MCX5046691.1 hypothetical protein [Aldersonia sp. NBC_00410]